MNSQDLERDERYALRYNGTEPCPGYLDISIPLLAYLHNLCPNILPFSIAICPYHQHVRPACLRDEVFLDGLFVRCDATYDGSFEQRERIAGVPFPIIVREVVRHQVARHGGDGKFSTGLWISEVEVLDVLVPCRSLNKSLFSG